MLLKNRSFDKIHYFENYRRVFLFKGPYGIEGNSDYGPLFGSGWDIAVADKCDNNNSGCTINSSYDFKGVSSA